MKKRNATKTAPTQIYARFARKPWTLNDVLYNSEPSAPWEAIEIEKRVVLTQEEYDEFARSPLDEREWMIGEYGGVGNGKRYVIEVTAPGRRTLYVDPSGTGYGRYVGIAKESE